MNRFTFLKSIVIFAFLALVFSKLDTVVSIFSYRFNSFTQGAVSVKIGEIKQTIEQSDQASGSLLKTDVKPSSVGQKLPGVLVVGVMKCGTGATLEMLRMHPKVRDCRGKGNQNQEARLGGEYWSPKTQCRDNLKL